MYFNMHDVFKHPVSLPIFILCTYPIPVCLFLTYIYLRGNVCVLPNIAIFSGDQTLEHALSPF